MGKYSKYLLLFFLFLILILHAEKSYACGTVKSWVNAYLDGNHSKQDKALFMIHCKPILTGKYKATPKEHEMLAKMIKKALKGSDYCDRNLATKSFFVFDQLFWLKESKLHNEIVGLIEVRLKRPVHEIKGSMSVYNRDTREDYCIIVNYEIKGMKLKGESRCLTDRCREIDMSPLEEKFRRVASFINKTSRCLPEDSKVSLKERVVQVKTETLSLRAKPTPKSRLIKKLLRNDLLLVKKVNNDWLKVIDKTCKEGWVAGYLTREARSR
jgi:hypothetical protein